MVVLAVITVAVSYELWRLAQDILEARRVKPRPAPPPVFPTEPDPAYAVPEPTLPEPTPALPDEEP